MLEIGDRLKSYEPLWENWYKDSYIGGGNFGKVYKLKQDFLGVVTYSAVKIISISLENEMVSKERKQAYIDEKKRFVAEEIKNMYKLKGRSNLVHCLAHAIRDVYDDNGEVAGFDVLIRMELYKSLPDHLKRNGVMDDLSIEKLSYQIGMALNSMHEINMLHRDIKPDNIYLDEKNVFYLGDFGVSKQMDSSSYSTLAGTQPFIAPEVWQVTKSNKNYSKTADIYSYGITLYYLLNENRLPLVTPESNLNQIEQAVVDRLAGKPFPPPKNGSPKLKAVVMKCCEYRPENRFQNMADVLSALRSDNFTYTQIGSAPKRASMPAAATVYAGNSMRQNAPVQPGYQGSVNRPVQQIPPMQQQGSVRQPVYQQGSVQQPVIRQNIPPQAQYPQQRGTVPPVRQGNAQYPQTAPAAAAAVKLKSKKKFLLLITAIIVAAVLLFVALYVNPKLAGPKEYTIKGTVNYDGDSAYSTFKIDSETSNCIPDRYFKGYDEDGCSITIELDTADVEPYNVYSEYLVSILEYNANDNLYTNNDSYIKGVPVGEYGDLFDNDEEYEFSKHAVIRDDGVFYIRMDNTKTLTFNLSAKCVKKILASESKGVSFQCLGVNITEVTIDAPKKLDSNDLIEQDFK